jgi:hypothetical protein
MSDTFYVSRSEVAAAGPLHRVATLEHGERFDMGVHGPVLEFYGLTPPRALPLPVDYIVASTGG